MRQMRQMTPLECTFELDTSSYMDQEQRVIFFSQYVAVLSAIRLIGKLSGHRLETGRRANKIRVGHGSDGVEKALHLDLIDYRWASIQKASAQFRVIVDVVGAQQKLRIRHFGPPIGVSHREKSHATVTGPLLVL